MNDGSLKIIIGAAADRSCETVFAGLEKRAQKASQNIGKSFANSMGGGTGGSGGAGRGFDAAAAAARKAEKEIEREIANQVRATKAAAREMKREHEQAARSHVRAEAEASREIIRGFKDATRERARELRKQEQDEARSAATASRNAEKFASRTSQRAVRFLVPNPIGAFGMARRIGGDILRGAGVDFSMSGMASRAVHAQEIATNLSNQGFMRNEKGANSIRVGGDTLEKEARRNAQSSGFTTEQALSAQTKFVDLTGNLDDARKAMPDILKLSGGTNTDPEKMAEAWANVSRHIGEVPDKAQKVYGLMKLIAGQGRVGSIEIKDEAKDLGKIAAMADKFAGPRDVSIGKLATMAQMARAEGGAASSAQAATSVVSFTNTFGTKQRVNALLAAGMKESDIFEMQGTGKNRVRAHIQDPFEIIKKALSVTGGDITKFGVLFKSVMAQRATNSIVAAYNSGGGHNMTAVDAQFKKFGSEAALSDQDVDEAQAARMQTASAQAKVFQEKLDEVGKQVQSELTPALTALAPKAMETAHAFGSLITWAAANPMSAVGAAVAAAIARAGIESAFRVGVEKMFTSAAGAGGGIALAGTVMLTAAAVTLINEDVRRRDLARNDASTGMAEAGAREGTYRSNAAKGFYTESEKSDLETINQTLGRRINRASSIGDYDKANGGAPTSATGIALEEAFHPERGEARIDASHISQLKTEMENNKRILDMIRTGTLKVQVMNPSPGISGGGPAVDPIGRDKGPGPWRQ